MEMNLELPISKGGIFNCFECIYNVLSKHAVVVILCIQVGWTIIRSFCTVI